MHLNGYPLVLMVFALCAAGFALKYGKGARVISVCGAAAAVLAVLAIPPWMDALARVFATGPGMVALVILAVTGGAVYLTDHWRHHHPVRTTIAGIIGGTAVVMAWAMAPELGAQGSKLGPQTAAALGQAQHQIASGHAAASVSGSTALVTIAVGALIVFAAGRFLHRQHKRRPFANARPFGGARAALPAGQGAQHGPGGHSGKKRGFFARMIGA